MIKMAMHILQVSLGDIGGGGEKIAWDFFKAYRAQGHHSWLAVRDKHNDDSAVLLIPNDNCRSIWARAWIAFGKPLSPLIGRVKGVQRLQSLFYHIGEPVRYLRIWQGHEDFDFPGTKRLLDLTAKRPDIVHCHTLLGGYFDLRTLPWLSHQIPVVFTLHDAWFMSGHCVHSIGCERWKMGCGKCPDLTIPIAIQRDATAYNWRLKRDIFSKSRLYVATPCRWLMQKAEQSILAPAMVEARVIPNGVDLSVFHPADKYIVRSALDIPQDAVVLLFTSNGIWHNLSKDYETMQKAVTIIAECLPKNKIIFIVLGEKKPPPETIGKAVVRFIPFKNNPEEVARYYQAADIYIHAAHGDTFPTTILEAMACGTPVVATSVGGIPEQVREGATGFLTPPKDAEAMAARVVQLIEDKELRLSMGMKAAEDAKKRFDLQRQAEEYLQWYDKILRESAKPGKIVIS